jgi:hypothetical protein
MVGNTDISTRIHEISVLPVIRQEGRRSLSAQFPEYCYVAEGSH